MDVTKYLIWGRDTKSFGINHLKKKPRKKKTILIDHYIEHWDALIE